MTHESKPASAPMIDEILFSVGPGQIRTALLAGGRPWELILARSGRGSVVGNVYLGRVVRVLPGMDAAFVEIGLERAAFLARAEARHAAALGRGNAVVEGGQPGPRIADRVREGEAVLVQAVKDAMGEKGVRVTTALTLPGRHLVYTPTRSEIAVSRRIEDEAERDRLTGLVAEVARPGEGFILRTAAVGAGAEALARDAEYLRALWAEVQDRRAAAKPPALVHQDLAPVPRVLRDHVRGHVRRILIDDRAALAEARRFAERFMPEAAGIELHSGPTPLFELYDIESEIERALSPRIELASGSVVVIESTEALTAIDVNTGRHVGRGSFAETILETNLEAAAEIARQVRLRNLGGLIVIDFVHMDRPDHRERVVETLRAAFQADPAPVYCGGMSPLGLIEMTRRRSRESLDQMLMEACPACGGGHGRVKSAATVAYEAAAAALRTAARAPGARLTVIAAPEVIDAFEGEAKVALEEMEAALGRGAALRREPGYARDRYEVVIA